MADEETKKDEWVDKMHPTVRAHRVEILLKVLEDMQSGDHEWTKPWVSAVRQNYNPVTGTVYKGVNVLHTTFAAMVYGYKDPRWVTWLEWKALEKQKGWSQKVDHLSGLGVPIESPKDKCKDKNGEWHPAVKKDGLWGYLGKGSDGTKAFIPVEDQEKDHQVFFTHSTVFNVELFDGVPPLPEIEGFEPNDDIEIGLIADDVIASSRCAVHEKESGEAYYSPLTDDITVPMREAFESNESFLSTLLHEMSHSTGNELKRDMSGRMMGTLEQRKSYAHEEIVAELTSMFSSADLGFELGDISKAQGYEEHLAYLEHWTGHLVGTVGKEHDEVLAEASNDFFKAASEAVKATDYIMDRYEEYVGHPAPGREPVKVIEGVEVETKRKPRKRTGLKKTRTAKTKASKAMSESRVAPVTATQGKEVR